VRGRSYAPRGQTPVTLSVGGTREKLSMISNVTNQGRANWMIIDGKFNHERLNANLKQAIGSMVPVRTKAKLHAAAGWKANFYGHLIAHNTLVASRFGWRRGWRD
jgi:hypothetical protein